MAIGGMRYRLLLERATETRGSSGGTARAWAPLKTVWAEFQPNRGREFFASRGLIAETNAVFRIRRTDLTAKDRATLGSQVYNVIDVIAENGRKDYLLAYCSTGAIPEGA